MTPAQVIPALSGSEHDSDKCLVVLVYDSTPSLPAPDTNSWLVGLDGSDNALRAVAQAASQAGRLTACALHLVHVQLWLSKEALLRSACSPIAEVMNDSTPSGHFQSTRLRRVGDLIEKGRVRNSVIAPTPVNAIVPDPETWPAAMASAAAQEHFHPAQNRPDATT